MDQSLCPCFLFYYFEILGFEIITSKTGEPVERFRKLI